MTVKKFTLCLLLAVIHFEYYCQTQPTFQKIDQSQGLSSSRITGIVKEEKGFVWIGTQNGLNRYDGFNVKIYNKQNSNIESNNISSLYLDRKNRIWLTTSGGGLNLYDRINDKFISYKNSQEKEFSIISNRINILTEREDGLFWIGTEKGLSLFDYDKNIFYNFPFNQQKSLNINSIYQDKNNNLWLGTFANGLFLFDSKTKKFTSIPQNKNQITSPINAITKLNSDEILLGTSGNGLLVVDLKMQKISNFLSHNQLLKDKTKITRSLKKDSKDNLWIGTDGYGLLEIQYPNSKEPIVRNYINNAQLSSSLSGNAIYVIAEDEASNMWIGTAWNGVSVLDKKNKTEIISSDIIGKNPNPVLSIFQNDKNIYLGLDGDGLNIYNKKNKKVKYYTNKTLGAKYIQKIFQSKDNNIWLGTFGNGLIRFNEKTKDITSYKNTFSNNQSISFNDVRDIVEDEKNNLWIATWGGGLNYFDRKANTFSRQNTGINKNIISILKDKNNIWLASFGGGLELFDIHKNKVTHFNYKETDTTSISSNNIFSLLKDTKGYLWIGTSGAGINRMNLKTNKIQRFENFENIKYKTITSIIEDNDFNIWFGSKKGIIKYDYENNTFKTFTNLKGDFHINSVYKDKAGFLYFGGIHGVTKFDPRLVNNTNSQPKVVIKSFKIFNKEAGVGANEILKKNITLTKEITLDYFHNVITFEFAALKFPTSENYEYSIKMENFDEDWRNIGTDRTATFTNLAPGNYTLKVKSRALSGSWGNTFTSLQITILKPYWQTNLAYAIYAILFTIGIYLFRKYLIAWGKLKSSLELEKITHEKDTELYNAKQQFFTNISHEIRTPVTLILSSINRLFDTNTNNEKDKRQIKASHTIRRNSNLLLRLVNELLDVRKLEMNDVVLNVTASEFVSFTREIFLSFVDIASDRNIKYRFNSNEKTIPLWFDKNQLEKVIFNLLSNAFKFTDDGGAIHLNIETSLNQVTLLVNDTGIGLSVKNQEKIFNRFYQVKYAHTEKNKGFGLGLSIAKEIIELHKGSVKVHSKLKEGTTFVVKLLKGNTHFNLNIDTKNSTENNTIHVLQNKISKRKSKQETILIVEDNLEIQEALKDLLEEENYTIKQACNGVEGLKLANTSFPSLIITDVMMPKMDGIELTKIIKSNTTTSHIPIIILTAKTASEAKKEGIETGADAYITKPYNEDFLKSRIKNLLKSRKLLKEKFVSNNLLNPKEITVNSKDQIFLERLYLILEKNLETNNVKAPIIAKQLHMSHSAMYKKIKSLTGLTYTEFIRDYRLSIAKQLIEEMGYSIADTCYKVGYSDRKYFSRLFKNKFKQNPSYYLNK